MKTEYVLVLVFAVIGGVVLLSLFSPMMGAGYGCSMMGFYGGIYIIIPFLVIVALVLFILWLTQQLTQTKRRQHG